MFCYRNVPSAVICIDFSVIIILSSSRHTAKCLLDTHTHPRNVHSHRYVIIDEMPTDYRVQFEINICIHNNTFHCHEYCDIWCFTRWINYDIHVVLVMCCDCGLEALRYICQAYKSSFEYVDICIDVYLR